jgi:formate hydrogenlyase transcriptional activator
MAAAGCESAKRSDVPAFYSKWRPAAGKDHAPHKALLFSEADHHDASLEEIPPDLLRNLREIIGVEAAGIFLVSPDGCHFELRAGEGLFHLRDKVNRIRAREGIAASIVAAGKAVAVHDLTDLGAIGAGISMCSALGAPLIIASRVVGLILFGARDHRTFSNVEAALADVAAGRIGSAIEKASVRMRYCQAQRQLGEEQARLRALLDINNCLVTKLNIQELFGAVSESLRQVTRHNYSQIVLWDRKRNQLKIAAVDFPNGKGLICEGLTVPLQGSPAGVVYTTREPLLINDLDADAFPSETTNRLMDEGVRSVCLAPLLRHGRALGVLSIGSAQQEAFTPADCTILSEVADQVAIAIENALAFEEIEELNRRLSKEKQFLEEELQAEGLFNDLVGTSPALMEVLKQVQTVAPTYATVLIVGETGTGKELLARAVHQLSGRRDGPFIKLNCASIPATLLESELFGHAKGAFTGAVSHQPGRLELADGGTIFLDEIGELPLELQPKLLRVLQERQFERLGDAKTININVRLVAATNRNLLQMVQKGEFRSDLYYRLNVFPVTSPSLRERREDIPALACYFAEKFSRQMQKHIPSIEPSAMETLTKWHWPGNVRELENFIERAVILSSGPELKLPSLTAADAVTPAPETLEDAEREHIVRVLKESGGLIGTPIGAAAKLGLKRTTLYAKMKKLGISRGRV